MPNIVEVEKAETVEFKWKKKRRIGRNKEIQFYESFIYDGVEYTLHDCVYFYKEGEIEPYVGKLVKIWERDKVKRVKVLWFFRPSEISNFIEGQEPLENELFLASGEGVGLANINPLEAICGKCNVVCISKDSRNPQPSQEELWKADFVFYRTFDVGQLKILDTIDEKIADVEVQFIFNRNECQKSNNVLENGPDKVEDGAAIRVTNEKHLLSKPTTSEEGPVKDDNDSSNFLGKDAPDMKASFGSAEMIGDHDCVAVDKTLRPTVYSDKFKGKVNDFHSQKATAKEDTFPMDSGLLVGSPDFSIKEDANVKASCKGYSADQISRDATEDHVAVDTTILKSKKVSNIDEGKVRSNLIKQAIVQEKLKSSKDSGLLEDRHLRKAEVDACISIKLLQEKDKNHVDNFDGDSKNVRPLEQVSPSNRDNRKFKRPPDLSRPESIPSKKIKTDDNRPDLSNGKSNKAWRPASENVQNNGQYVEVNLRTDAERNTWYKGLPWEERIKKAREQGTLVLLQNLDPSYTSAEVEDIIRDCFKETCSVKVIPQRAISNPYSGEAFVIFKRSEAAQMVVRKLDKECLILSNGRTLVGSMGTNFIAENHPPFFGHFGIDKIKYLTQREMKLAVSTSHCSQPNTIEYEMAMEWRLLQSRSGWRWKKLYKKQWEELRKMRANLKPK